MSRLQLLGKELRRGREKLGLTLQQVADALGVSVSLVQQNEAGDAEIPGMRLIDHASLLQIDLAGLPVLTAKPAASQKKRRAS